MKKISFIALAFITLFSCKSQDKDYLITLETKYGNIQMILYDQTPKHKENFIKLAKQGEFDSTTFHRIIEGFMIQGGDINAKPGNEDEIDYTIPAEFVDTLFHARGAIGAARQGDVINPEKASNGSQFYIVQGTVFEDWQLTTDLPKVNAYLPKLAEVPGYDTILNYLDTLHQRNDFEKYNRVIHELVPVMEDRFDVSLKVPMSQERLKVYTTVGGAPHLDDEYTVFGRVVNGMDVVDKIAAVPTEMEKPLEDIYVKVALKEMPKEEWNKKYGGNPY